MEGTVGGYAFNVAAKGKVSAPITGNGGVFVTRSENIFARPNDAVNVEEQRKSLMMNQRNSGGNRAMEILKKTARVKDKRSEIY
jgi:peptidyl-prolyl cis-trans isomerase D